MNAPDAKPARTLAPEKQEWIKSQLRPLGFKIKHSAEYDDQSHFGIAIEFFDQGDWCRAAVLLPKTPSLSDITETVELLFTARFFPDLPGVTVVRGAQELTGNEMKTSSLLET